MSTNKLPEWPEELPQPCGLGDVISYYKGAYDAALARMEALVEYALEAKVSELRAERSEFDCRFAGRHWEASGSHCPTDRPCLRCQRDRLAAENAALREDAERYRWLKNSAEWSRLGAGIVTELPRADWDGAIDAARRAGEGE